MRLRHKQVFGAMGAITAMVVSTGAFAIDYTDTAPVIAAAPIYDQVSAPRQECFNDVVTTAPQETYVERRNHNSLNPGGAIVGGIAGGVLGHQIGGGRGRDVATVAGTIAGALVGSNVANAHSRDATTITRVEPAQERVVQRCRTVQDSQDILRGYDVTYRYGGRDTTVRLPYNPGSSVRVAVGIVTDSPTPTVYEPSRRY